MMKAWVASRMASAERDGEKSARWISLKSSYCRPEFNWGASSRISHRAGCRRCLHAASTREVGKGSKADRSHPSRPRAFPRPSSSLRKIEQHLYYCISSSQVALFFTLLRYDILSLLTLTAFSWSIRSRRGLRVWAPISPRLCVLLDGAFLRGIKSTVAPWPLPPGRA